MMETWAQPAAMDEAAWEGLWAPYDRATYQVVLQYIHPQDIILEIGAGDLRLARLIAGTARRVYAIETQARLLASAFDPTRDTLPVNLVVVVGNALWRPFWADITAAVLLMRHCRHFRIIAEKLKAAGCQRLITNARWRMGVEQIWLGAPRIPYSDVKIGWYACWCGAAGFKPGPAEDITAELDAKVFEVTGCPYCSGPEK